ncbi:hypothetical protein CC86DRAFT_271354, partial [Ophiobolus disseminans]
QSPLLRLPGEIRNAIYKYALCHRVINVNGDPTTSSLLGLTRTCRQIYNQTEILLYSQNKFQMFSRLELAPWLSKRTTRQLSVIST